MRIRRVITSSGAVMLLTSTLGVAGPVAAEGAGPAVAPLSYGYTSNILTSVSALSPTDVWIIGNHVSPRGSYQPVVRHFDGVQWKRVGQFPLHGSTAYPTSIQALSAGDVWVLLSSIGAGVSRVAHWDGSVWTLTTMPGGSSAYHLWADSDSDVWVVGEGSTIEHFDGQDWSTMQTPGPSGTELFGVSGTGPDDVWMVGHYDVQSTYEMLLMHWDGQRWLTKLGFSQPGSTDLWGVVVLSPTDAWATGTLNDSTHGIYRGLTLHWNGKHWADSYQDLLPSGYMYDIAATSPSDVWVVGAADKLAVAAHWNGHAWHAAHPQSPGSSDNRLLAVSADSPTDVWAVGYWDRPGLRTRMIQHWNGERWTWVRH